MGTAGFTAGPDPCRWFWPQGPNAHTPGLQMPEHRLLLAHDGGCFGGRDMFRLFEA